MLPLYVDRFHLKNLYNVHPGIPFQLTPLTVHGADTGLKKSVKVCKTFVNFAALHYLPIIKKKSKQTNPKQSIKNPNSRAACPGRHCKTLQ